MFSLEVSAAERGEMMTSTLSAQCNWFASIAPEQQKSFAAFVDEGYMKHHEPSQDGPSLFSLSCEPMLFLTPHVMAQEGAAHHLSLCFDGLTGRGKTGGHLVPPIVTNIAWFHDRGLIPHIDQAQTLVRNERVMILRKEAAAS